MDHHRENYNIWEEANRNRQAEEQLVDDLIVKKGALELNYRVAQTRLHQV